MLRKTYADRALQLKNERIYSGIREWNGSLAPIGDKVNGYTPENVAIERIYSGIRHRRELGTVDFLIFSV